MRDDHVGPLSRGGDVLIGIRQRGEEPVGCDANQAKGRMVFRLHRPLTFQRPVLVDADLQVHGVDEVCRWAKNGAEAMSSA